MVAQIDKVYRGFGLGTTAVRALSYLAFEGRPITARGRWINSLVIGWLGVIARLGPRASDLNPVFIVGTGRSGTSILGTTLSIHRNVGFLNEPKALWHVACPFEDIIGNYSQHPGRYILREKEATAEIAERFRRLYGAYLAISSRECLVDKYPEVLFRWSFILSIFPGARFIWLVRNGNDTIASIAAWSKKFSRQSKLGKEDWWGLNERKWKALSDQVVPVIPDLAERTAELAKFDRQEDRAAVEWVASANFGISLEQSHPGSVLRVGFEHLMQEPEAVLTTILRFCELEQDTRVLDFARAKFQKLHSYESQVISDQIRSAFQKSMIQLNYSAC